MLLSVLAGGCNSSSQEVKPAGFRSCRNKPGKSGDRNTARPVAWRSWRSGGKFAEEANAATEATFQPIQVRFVDGEWQSLKKMNSAGNLKRQDGGEWEDIKGI